MSIKAAAECGGGPSKGVPAISSAEGDFQDPRSLGAWRRGGRPGAQPHTAAQYWPEFLPDALF